jgi:hypothetical protein
MHIYIYIYIYTNTHTHTYKGTNTHDIIQVGSGVKGGGTPGYVCYGATKRGQPQMTDSLVAELEKGVQVCLYEYMCIYERMYVCMYVCMYV